MLEAVTSRAHVLAYATLAALMLAGVCDAQQTSSAPTAAEVAPDFALRSLSGSNIRLSEYRGSVVLLGFWARWCGDCRQAMQALNSVQAKYERAGLITLGINVDDSFEQAASMTQSLGLQFPVLVDTDKTASSLFNLKSMPLLVLIDRDGRVRYSHGGFERGQELLITEQLRQLLNE
ncbi:MAG: TlpA disulfide reductase family protein [Steroidobacteraceae bacterium]